jgi:hypothetical protein
MATLLETAQSFFVSRNWSFERVEAGAILRLSFAGKNGSWPCFFEAKEEIGVAVFYSVRPGSIAPAQRVALAELLMRLNTRLNVGNFELSYEDGSIRFRTGIDVEGHGLTLELMNNLSLTNVASMDKHLPAIEAVLAGQSPLSAVSRLL